MARGNRTNHKANKGSFRKDDPRANAGGKSTEIKNVEQEFSQALIEELCRIDKGDPRRRRTNIEAIARRWVRMAKTGNLSAIRALAERMCGKPGQPAAGMDGKPLEVRVIVERIGG